MPTPPAGSVTVSRPAAARRHRYRRRHTLHYYLVVSGLTLAGGVVALDVPAYASRSVGMATIAFFAILVTALVIFSAFFLGFYMLMNGHIPVHRIKLLVPHAAVGVLSPLLYTLNICLAVDGVGNEPVSGGSLICSVLSFLLLTLQFAMGKLVVRPARLHVIRR